MSKNRNWTAMTQRLHLERRHAQCKVCDFCDYTKKANVNARNHVTKTGHKVDVFSEVHKLCFPFFKEIK
jgi:hypothetical protein